LSPICCKFDLINHLFYKIYGLHDVSYLIISSGDCSIGLPVGIDSTAQWQQPDLVRLTIASYPEHSIADEKDRRSLIWLFYTLGFANIIITALLYAFATKADGSKLNSSENYLPSQLDRVANSRTPAEQEMFAFTILTILLGIISSVQKFPLGISVYILSTAIIFFCSASSIPYFVFSLRYILDGLMIYVAFALRARLIVNFLSF